jgi:hypothetical protein
MALPGPLRIQRGPVRHDAQSGWKDALRLNTTSSPLGTATVLIMDVLSSLRKRFAFLRTGHYDSCLAGSK